MLRGRFDDTSGRPYIEGFLILPRFRIWSNISFLVDTGADTSRLHPRDGFRMGLDYSRLQGRIESIGTGGLVQDFQDDAVVIFNEGVIRYYSYNLKLAIALPTAGTMSLPSLLGRDILDRWEMRYNPSKKLLLFKVVSADSLQKFPLNLRGK